MKFSKAPTTTDTPVTEEKPATKKAAKKAGRPAGSTNKNKQGLAKQDLQAQQNMNMSGDGYNLISEKNGGAILRTGWGEIRMPAGYSINFSRTR